MQESIDEPLVEKLKRRLATLRVGDPLDKNTDVGAINSRDAARQDHGARRSAARRRARRSTSRRAGCRRRASGSRRRCSRTSRRATASRRRRSSARCSRVLTFRTPEEAVEKANNTPYGLSRRRLDGEGLAHPLDGRAPARRRRLGEHVQPLRPGLAVRRLQGVRLRPRGRPPRARAVPRGSTSERDGCPSRRRTSSSSAARSRARESGRTYEARGPERRARLAQGRPRRGAGRARRARRRGRATTAYNRGQVLYRLAEMMEARAAELAELLQRAATRSSARSTASSGTRAGPTSSRRCSARRTRSPARTSTSRCPSRPASSAIVAPDEPPLARARLARSLPALVGGNAVVAVASETHPLAAIELAEAVATSDVPGGVVNILTGLRAELAPWLAGAHGRERDRRHRAPTALAAELERARRRERQARRARLAPTSRARGRSPRFLELKTVWHPIGQ